MRLTLLFFFIALSNFISLTQQHIFQKVNIELPSPECYRIIQDTKGQVWVATEQGLCNYDGQKTLVFNAKNGLPEKGVYALKTDEKGVVWALTKTGRLIQLKNNSILHYGIKNLNGITLKEEIGYELFFQKGKLIVPFTFGNVVTLDLERKKEKKYISNLPNGYSLIIKDNNQTIPYVISQPSKNHFYKNLIRYEDKQYPQHNQTIESQLITSFSSQIITCTLKNRAFFSISNQLIEIDAHGKKHQHTFPHRILSLLPDSRGGLWVGVLGNGIYHFEDADFSKPAVNSLQGLSVSNIMEDREQHIWCTTLEKGVYRCQQPAIITYSNFPGLGRRMDYLGAESGQFVASTTYNELIFVDNNHQQTRVKLAGNYGEAITGIHCIDQEWIVGHREMVYSGFKLGNCIQLKKRKDILSCIQFQKRSDVLYSIGYPTIIHRYKENKFVSIINEPIKHPKCFFPLSPQKFLVVLVDKTVVQELKNGLVKTKIIHGAPKSIGKIIYAEKSNRYFAITKGSGIYEWKNEKFVSCSKQMQLSIDVLNDIIEDDQGNLWIATNEGLLFCPFDGKDFKKPKLYTEKHGFPSDVCDKLAINGKYLAVSTTEGLTTFPLNCKLESAIDPQILLQDIFIGGKSTTLQRAKLRYDENSIKLHFSVLSYHQPTGQSIYYTLEKNGEIEKGISTPTLHLQNMAPGNYKLRVFGRNIYGINSIVPFIIDFEILPPFWATWWFILCCIAVGLLILLVLFLWIKRQIEFRAEQDNRVKVQLAKSQLTALQAQMNPHFLFNSISSIQNFIMSNKREEAYNYLTSFSKLIRNTLNNSRSQFVSLEKELETIELYMQLEQQRFNNTFNFYIELSKDILPSAVFLPASLIQPLLENALWHGIMPVRKERHGVITLQIILESDFLRISVIDNGKGIQNSDKLHQSLALKIIEEQLELLAINMHKKYNTRVELQANENGEGIKASFIIPLLNNL